MYELLVFVVLVDNDAQNIPAHLSVVSVNVITLGVAPFFILVAVSMSFAVG